MRLWVSRRQQEAEVLAAIEAGHQFGFAISQVTRLGAGRVTITLFRLERDGRVRSDWERPRPADRPPRRMYEVVKDVI